MIRNHDKIKQQIEELESERNNIKKTLESKYPEYHKWITTYSLDDYREAALLGTFTSVEWYNLVQCNTKLNKLKEGSRNKELQNQQAI